jgi:hypothetical protein
MLEQGVLVAIAIDGSRFPSDDAHNPYITAVPEDLAGQQILEIVYRNYVKDSLQEEGSQPEFYRFDYLWFGRVNNGVVIGTECTEGYSLRPWDRDRFDAMVEAVDRDMKA